MAHNIIIRIKAEHDTYDNVLGSLAHRYSAMQRVNAQKSELSVCRAKLCCDCTTRQCDLQAQCGITTQAFCDERFKFYAPLSNFMHLSRVHCTSRVPSSTEVDSTNPPLKN